MGARVNRPNPGKGRPSIATEAQLHVTLSLFLQSRIATANCGIEVDQ
jgi:hypothetical protein